MIRASTTRLNTTSSKPVTTLFLKKIRREAGETSFMKGTLEGFWESTEIKSHCEDLPAKQDPHMAFLMKPIGGISPGIKLSCSPHGSLGQASQTLVR